MNRIWGFVVFSSLSVQMHARIIENVRRKRSFRKPTHENKKNQGQSYRLKLYSKWCWKQKKTHVISCRKVEQWRFKWNLSCRQSAMSFQPYDFLYLPKCIDWLRWGNLLWLLIFHLNSTVTVYMIQIFVISLFCLLFRLLYRWFDKQTKRGKLNYSLESWSKKRKKESRTILTKENKIQPYLEWIRQESLKETTKRKRKRRDGTNYGPKRVEKQRIEITKHRTPMKCLYEMSASAYKMSK